jgi:hypothetical protein
MVTKIQLFESPNLTPLDLFVRLDSEVYKRKDGYTNELIARILDAAASIKKRGEQLRRTTRDLRTRVAKCVEVDGGIFERLL